MEVCDHVALTIPLRRDVGGFDVSEGVEGAECLDGELARTRGCVKGRRETCKYCGVKWECEVEVVSNCDEDIHGVWLTRGSLGPGRGEG